MPDKILSTYGVNEQRMFSELSELEAIIRSAVPADGSETGGSVALIRLVHGLSEEEMHRFLKAHELADRWVPVSLSRDFPALDRFSRILKRLIQERDRDYLTGLRNRRFFERVLDREMELGREFRVPVTLVILDVDDFKDINDTFGHSVGDRVLRELAGTISSELRATDVAARIGGEEFALILSGSGKRQSEKILQRLRERISNSVLRCDRTEKDVTFTASFGAVTYRGVGETDWKTLFEAADKALYLAKEMGKNRVEIAVLTGLRTKDAAVVGREEKKFLFSG
ncbi:MAG: GGDEF domain-containing protein [Desulfonatronovibrionaceae bacterium]